MNVEVSTEGIEPQDWGAMTADGVDRLVKALNSETARLERRLGMNLERAEKYRAAAKGIESDLHSLRESLAIARGEKRATVSLLYKRRRGSAYIKGRCWWNGKHREVQIGSIPSVLAKINELIKRSDIEYLETLDDKELTWEVLKENSRLVQAIKELGAQKFRQYMIRKLQAEHFGGDQETELSKVVTADLELERLESEVGVYEEDAADDWYAQWRNQNR